MGTNSRFAKAGVKRFQEIEVLNSSFVRLMKFSAENPRLRQALNLATSLTDHTIDNENGKTTNSKNLDTLY